TAESLGKPGGGGGSAGGSTGCGPVIVAITCDPLGERGRPGGGDGTAGCGPEAGRAIGSGGAWDRGPDGGGAEAISWPGGRGERAGAVRERPRRRADASPEAGSARVPDPDASRGGSRGTVLLRGCLATARPRYHAIAQHSRRGSHADRLVWRAARGLGEIYDQKGASGGGGDVREHAPAARDGGQIMAESRRTVIDAPVRRGPSEPGSGLLARAITLL